MRRMVKRRLIKRRIIFIALVLILFIWGKNLYKTPSTADFRMNENMDGIKYLELLSSQDRKIAKIMKHKEEYPPILLEMLSRNLDMTDYVSGYLDKKGQVFSDDIGRVTKGKFPLLLQYDAGWGYGMYGDEVIAVNGCGPTSLAMVIAGLTGRNDITPYDVATYAYQNGHYAGGTSWSLFTQGVNNYGITGSELSLSKEAMLHELEQGHPIICSMGAGAFTTTGHIIVISGAEDGRFIVNDPNSRERSDRLWSYEEISSQIKNLWSFKLK